jgi:hypothetical protein
MSHWNYRILARKVGKEIQFGFYEVHYDENNKPIACTENPVYPLGFDEDVEDPIESIKWQLDAMKLATDKLVINYDDFPNVYVKYYRKKKLMAIEKYFE